jgi:hypothetical protein
MNLVSRESIPLGVLEIGHKIIHGLEVLRTCIGPYAVPVRAEQPIDREVDSLAEA